MSIPDHLIEEVRLRADLVEIVSEYTTLKRSGKTFRGPCPLHGGEGPNFSVDPGKGVFKCFVCGEAGDVFSFPMKHLGLDFLEAVRFVAGRVGVEIPDPAEQRSAVDPNARYYEVNAFAADWYRRQLKDDTAGEVARAYLKKRGISDDAAERFALGWAPEAWTAFGDAARAHGISDDILLSLGLVKESTKGGREPYDAFRGRLIFPIEDLGGRIVAFGGRILVDAAEHVPKYLNSPETPVYRKGDVLYGLRWSRGAIRKAERALVVEGYMDYVSLAAQGVENVVAPLGTALTTAQGTLIARYARTVVLLYDSDLAGMKATFRSGDELLRAGVEVLVATLPEGEDPDSIVRAGGAKALRKYVDDAVDVLERKLQILERRDFFSSIAGVRRAVDALLPTIRAASDEVLRGVYLTRISEKTGVPRDALEREVAAGPARNPRDARPAAGQERRHNPQGRRAEDFGARQVMVRTLGAERNLILLLLRDESWVERAARDIGPEDFRDPIYRRIFEELLQVEGKRDAEGEWLQQFPPEVLAAVEELRGDPEAAHMEALESFYADSLRRIQARPFHERLAEIERQLRLVADDEGAVLIAEKTEIVASLRARGLMKTTGQIA